MPDHYKLTKAGRAALLEFKDRVIQVAVSEGIEERADDDYVAHLLGIGRTYWSQLHNHPDKPVTAKTMIVIIAGLKSTHRIEVNSEKAINRSFAIKFVEGEHYKVIASDSISSISPETNLRYEYTSFHGRDDLMNKIKGKLVKPPCSKRIFVLHGPGGCGKTQFVKRMCHALREDCPDTWWAWFVPLEAQRTSDELLHKIASELKVKTQTETDTLDGLTKFIGDKIAILVLDNFEQLVQESEQRLACENIIVALLRECPNLHIFVTSRERLHIPSGQYYPVPGLHYAEEGATLSNEDIERYPAAKLFMEHTAATAPDIKAVMAACRLLEGLPLAIEIVASRVTDDNPIPNIKDLEKLLHLETKQGEMPSKTTMRGTIAWSYDLLAEEQKTLLSRLSVFRGGWTLATAQAVCADDTITPEDVKHILDILADKALVVETDNANRYHLHEMIRQYAAEELHEKKEETIWQTSHRNHFLKVAEEAEEKRTTGGGANALNVLDKERDNLLAALKYCLTPKEGEDAEQEAEMAHRYVGALWRYWEMRGNLSEARQHLSNVMGRVGAEKPTPARGKALRAHGRIAQSQGDMKTAERWLRDSVTAYEQAITNGIPDELGKAMTQVDLGWVLTHHGGLTEALELYTPSLQLLRAKEDRGVASVLYNMGIVYYYQGKYENASDALRESWELHEVRGSKTGMAIALIGWGNTLVNQSKFATAREKIRTSLELYQELNDKVGISSATVYLGCLQHYTARSEAEHQAASQAIIEGLHPLICIGWTDVAVTEGWRVQAAVALKQKQAEAARVAVRKGLSISRGMGDIRQVAALLEMWARCLLAEEQAEQAIAIMRVASTLRQKIGAPIKAVDRGEPETAHAQTFSSTKTADEPLDWEEIVAVILAGEGSR